MFSIQLNHKKATFQAVTYLVLTLLCETLLAQTQSESPAASSPNIEDKTSSTIGMSKKDCDKPVAQIAADNLSPEQKKATEGSFLESTGIGSAISSATGLFNYITTGTTPQREAIKAFEANRVAAIKYKAQFCGPTTAESIQTAASSPANPNAANVQVGVTEGGVSGTIQRIVGLNDWEGEIVGKISSGSKFENLIIGMNASAVMAKIGPPDDSRIRATSRALVPFYHGRDKRRWEFAYKDIGRLIFSSDSVGTAGEAYFLIQIIPDLSQSEKL